MQPLAAGSNSPRYPASTGFTLIELLVAMAIFAIISVITMVSLRQMIMLSKNHEEIIAALEQSQLAYAWLQQDLLNTVSISGAEHGVALVLEPSLPLTNIEYTLDAQLSRQQGADSQILLRDLSEGHIYYYNEKGDLQKKSDPRDPARFIVFDLELKTLGKTVWAFPL